MPMPKATMNEDHLPLSGENEVGLSGKVGNVEPEFIAARTRDFSHQEFRFCVLAADERHPLAALKPRKRIHDRTIRIGFADGTAWHHCWQPTIVCLWKNYTTAAKFSKKNYSLFHRHLLK